MLTENYNSEELAAKLVSLGDASFIDRKLEPTSDHHKFGTPEPDVCVFYHRDREEDLHTTLYPTKAELCSCYYYSYVWKDGSWHFYKGGNLINIYEKKIHMDFFFSLMQSFIRANKY